VNTLPRTCEFRIGSISRSARGHATLTIAVVGNLDQSKLRMFTIFKVESILNSGKHSKLSGHQSSGPRRSQRCYCPGLEGDRFRCRELARRWQGGHFANPSRSDSVE